MQPENPMVYALYRAECRTAPLANAELPSHSRQHYATMAEHLACISLATTTEALAYQFYVADFTTLRDYTAKTFPWEARRQPEAALPASQAPSYLAMAEAYLAQSAIPA